MLAAGASRGTYVPEAAPLFKLLRDLAARPSVRGLILERQGLRIELHGGPGVQ
jgi:oxaloacetate decarboxylase alpha subunit